MSETSEIATKIINDTVERYAPRYPERFDFLIAMMAEQIRLLQDIDKKLQRIWCDMPDPD